MTPYGRYYIGVTGPVGWISHSKELCSGISWACDINTEKPCCDDCNISNKYTMTNECIALYHNTVYLLYLIYIYLYVFGSGNGLLPDNKSLLELMLTNHYWGLSPEGNFTVRYPWYEFKNSQFKITAASFKSQCVKREQYCCGKTNLPTPTSCRTRDFSGP